MSVDLKRTRKSARRVARFLDENPKTPSSEDIHQLRSSARHLESTFTALGLGSLPKLDKIRKSAGRVRDLDVLTASALTVELGEEQECLVRLVEHLGARRSKSAKKLRRLVRKTRPGFRRSVKRSVRKAEKRVARSSDSGAETTAAARAIRFSSELGRTGRLSKNNLHQYRIKLKELRDILRLSGRADHSSLLKHLDEVKDAIGGWHDEVELVAIAEEALDHGPSCKLMKHLRTITDSKYEHALSLTQGFARRYLAPKPKKTAAPALEAASAIAEP